MKLAKFLAADGRTSIGIVEDDGLQPLELGGGQYRSLTEILESDNPAETVRFLVDHTSPRLSLATVTLLSPLDEQEVWAAGVTYKRSRAARMEESVSAATVYDRVYSADRPELFFKSLAYKVVAPGNPVRIRRDSAWNVPEPELALIINSRGGIVGYTIGNDMSSRDIEGENLLYLPQAKMYDRSCAVGPFVVVGVDEQEARTWKIGVEIIRLGKTVFAGETSIDQIKRSFKELAGFLCRSQTFSHGAVLLTGTGIVPNDDFTLQQKDTVRITVSGIGTLVNSVAVV